MKKVAVIGAGLQAHRRLQPILDDKEYAVPLIVDLYEERAQMLAKSCDAAVSSNWRDAVNDPGIDAILLLTYPDSHAKIAIAAMKKGKDVLCEKPLARTETEAKKMIKVAHETKRILKCGFNHRHHPAVVEMHKLFESGLIGKAVFGRGRYGIAGRSGVEKEWRSNPKIVSGGQLMEQGIHLVDLYRWFLGDMTKATGMVATNYWPMQPLEDNAFAVMQNKDGVMVSIHSSLTRYLKEKYPDLDIEIEAIWPGMIGVSKDLLPIVGEDTREPGIFYVSAASGLPWAAALGRYIAEKITTGRSDFDHDFRPNRPFPISNKIQRIISTQPSYAFSHALVKKFRVRELYTLLLDLKLPFW
jgi:predicted dehydrogenase